MSLTLEQQDALFQAIHHGSEEHRQWLREAIRAHYAGEPIPPVSPAQSPEPAPFLSHLEEALEKVLGWDSAHPSKE